MKKGFKKLSCLLLALMMVISFAACSKDSGDVDPKLAKFIEEQGSDMEEAFESSFGSSSGMDCECEISGEGTKLILDCKIDGFNDLSSSEKKQVQDIYDSMSSQFKTMFSPLKEEVSTLTEVVINVCEEDGDLIAKIETGLE